MKIVTIVAALLMSLVGMSSCRQVSHNPDLLRADTLSNHSPLRAIALLDSVNPEGLNLPDRHYYDLLCIKANDKAYIEHTSDSLILDVIDYYSSHRNSELYPVVLYYGGRVYSDLGDYPRAIKYYQNALDELEYPSVDLNFKANVLSQTGRLLNQLRLFTQAKPYLRQAVDIDRAINDTLSLYYDLKLCGKICQSDMEFDTASVYFAEALQCASSISLTDSADVMVSLASLQYQKGNLDSALKYVRGLPEKVSPLTHNRALAVASQIYHNAGIYDTAYIYASQLIQSSLKNNQMVGYDILLSPEVRRYIPQDSLLHYCIAYAQFTESYLNTNEAQEALMQNSFYNYQIFLRERDAAEKSKRQTWYILIGTLLFASLLSIVILIQKNHNAQKTLQLHRALDLIESLQHAVDICGNISPATPSKRDVTTTAVQSDQRLINAEFDSSTYLRAQIRAKLQKIGQGTLAHNDIASKLAQTQTGATLRQYIQQGRSLTDYDPLWPALALEVEKLAPNFRRNLDILTSGRLSECDFQIALLIKCNITPSDMAILLNKTKSAISSRREYLSRKMGSLAKPCV